MLVLSALLLTLWLCALALDVAMGGWVHLLAVTALSIVLARKTHGERRA
jgi:hypothetical protein